MFFDNFRVTHEHGRILEENHYYAYGLRNACISSRAYGAPGNEYGYQGDYSELDEDIGWNDFELRSYDAQIGRFIEQDPYGQFASGYMGMGDNPIYYIDPSGGAVGDPIITLSEVVIYSVRKSPTFWSMTGNLVKGIGKSVVGTVAGLVSAVAHPVNTAVGLANAYNHPEQVALGMYHQVKQGVQDFRKGNGDRRAEMVGYILGDIGQLLIGTEELKAGTEALKITKEGTEIIKLQVREVLS